MLETQQEHDAPAEQVAVATPITLIAKLASSIPAKQSLLLAIVRVDDEQLLVTIQPTPTDKDKGTALPLQVKGKPEEIDAALLTALETYLPAREFVIQTAQEVADATKAAAEKAKAEATKPKTPAKPVAKTPPKSTPAKSARNAGQSGDAEPAADDVDGEQKTPTDKQPAAKPEPAKPKHPGRATITVDPADASITATVNGETFELTSGDEASLPVGIVKFTITKDGYEPLSKNLAIGANLRTESFTLAKSLSLFGNESESAE